VYEASVKVTLQAMKNATEAVVEWKTGRCELAGMRDLPDPDGERLICGWNPDEPADDTLVDRDRDPSAEATHACA
ncbi:MAG: hypothetical protein RLO18_07975, partial [Gimesia chilikensis]